MLPISIVEKSWLGKLRGTPGLFYRHYKLLRGDKASIKDSLYMSFRFTLLLVNISWSK
jgi:hypothetical protein